MSNYYILRSKLDGKYLVAKVAEARTSEDGEDPTYLLLFKEDFEALTYLNTHAKESRDRLGVEFLSSSQIKSLLQRWGYRGIGLVEDPLLPQIKFLTI